MFQINYILIKRKDLILCLRIGKKECDDFYECIKGRFNFTLGIITLMVHGDNYSHANEHKHNILVNIMSICGMILGANCIYTGLHDLLDEREE
jgi:hypothetical protein